MSSSPLEETIAATDAPASPASDAQARSEARRAARDRPPEESRPPRAGGVRPEIQALRAIAVSIVVVFHYWPHILPGGFVGVDVFFAISGFLISAHLLREVGHSGRVSIGGFWARRARRILPAALFVLAFCAVMTIIYAPQDLWKQWFSEIRDSTLYIQNWNLANSAVNYFGSANAPSPVQHYWSLSVEEQFYIVWPLVILATALIWRMRPGSIRRVPLAIVLGILTVVSLAYSIVHTKSDPAAAYFITPTRAWEFGLGGLLALLAPEGRASPAIRALVSWLGLIAIAIAAVAYYEPPTAAQVGGTPFPGIAAALPVLGCLAVIWAGTPARVWAPTWPMRLRPVQFMGDISYSVYLWHFPFLVFAPLVLSVAALHTKGKLALVVLTIVAAYVTKLLIEDPIRSGPILTRRRARWTFAAAAVGMLIVVAVSGASIRHVDQQIKVSVARSNAPSTLNQRCFGPKSRDPEHPCKNPKLADEVNPTPAAAAATGNAPCHKEGQVDLVTACSFGEHRSQARRTFALIGDSHAAHWRAGLTVMAKALHWRGITIARTSCALSTATKVLVEPVRSQCVKWNTEVPPYLAQHPEISIAIISAHNGGSVVSPPGVPEFQAEVNGYEQAWEGLPKSIKHIIVIRDDPHMLGSTMRCVEAAINSHSDAGEQCKVKRSAALPPDPEAVAAKHITKRHVQIVDLTRFMCSPKWCYPVVGGVLVHKDIHHYSKLESTLLGPYVTRRVRQLIRSWAPNPHKRAG